MPLNKSKSKAAFKENVSEMVRAGHPVKQALAAAYRNQRGKKDGGAIQEAISTARKYAKRAGGGTVKARSPSENIEDRRKEANSRFNDSLYWQPNPSVEEGQPVPLQDWPDILANKAYVNPLADQAGAINLDAHAFADGGDVDDSWKDREARANLAAQSAPAPAAPSNVDWGQGLKRWWYGDQKPDINTEPNLLNDPVSRMGSGLVDWASTPGKAYQEGLTPQEETDWGAGTAVGMIGTGLVKPSPGLGAAGGYTKKGMENIHNLHKTVLDAVNTMPGTPEAPYIAHDLKKHFPKDIASSAFYLGLEPEDISVLQDHMTTGAQGAFDKHYSKLIQSKGGKEEAPKPKPKPAETSGESEFHDALPNGFVLNPLGSSGWTVNKAGETNVHYALAMDKEGAVRQFYESNPQYKSTYQHQSIPKELNPIEADEYRAAGNEESLKDYEDWFEQQQAKEQLINEGGIPDQPEPSHGDTYPTEASLHPSLVPSDLSEKAQRLGLNVSAFHGTPHRFSEFKLPEEMGQTPEIGVHFGTLKAAIDRNYHTSGMGKEALREYFSRNEGIAKVNNDLALNSDFSPQWNIIPSKIGIANPLITKDLGTWTPGRIAAALKENPNFTHSEIQSALADYSPYEGLSQRSKNAMMNLRKLIESKGYDSIVYKNAVEDPGSTSFIIWNLNKARSFYAKFDPAHAQSRNIGAGLAGLSLVPLSLYEGAGQGQEAEGKAKGGRVKHKQIDEDPQDHEFINFSKGGLIDSHIPGRTDKIPMKVSPGAYVLPADIPSALGQGNSKAGAEILKKMFTHSAYGLPPPQIHGKEFHYPRPLHIGRRARGGKVEAAKALPEDHQLGMKVPKGGSMCANCHYLKGKDACANKGFVEWNGGPKLPEPANEYCCDLYEHKPEKKADGGGSDHVPIVAAGGEYIIHPDVVKHVGNGSMKAGHRVLDQFVLHTRKQHINTLKKLKPPK